MQPLFADILLVDDDPAICESYRTVLEEEGFHVATAAHGADALDYLRTIPLPRLIILDLMMPIMDGWSFLQVHRQDETLRSIPVVVLSAQVLSEQDAARLHVALYLRKPINIVSLLMIAETYCRPISDETAREAQA